MESSVLWTHPSPFLEVLPSIPADLILCLTPPPLCLWTHIGATKDKCRVSILSTRAHGAEQHQVAQDNRALTASSLEAVLFLQPVRLLMQETLAPTLARLLSADEAFP